MKTLAFLLLFCTASYGADITSTNVVGDITKVISERQDNTGKPQFRVETSYRGKQKVLQVLSRPNKAGKMTVTSRGYCLNGRLVMVEGDDDRDGKFEKILVYGSGSDDFEMFTRQPDGTVMPASTKDIELMKQQKAIADESMGKLIRNPKMSDQELSKLLQENQQKIQALQKQNGDDTKPNEPPR